MKLWVASASAVKNNSSSLLRNARDGQKRQHWSVHPEEIWKTAFRFAVGDESRHGISRASPKPTSAEVFSTAQQEEFARVV